MIATLPRLHAVTDDRVLGEAGGEGRAVAAASLMAAAAAAAGAALAVHLRTRALTGAGLLRAARSFAAALGPTGAWLVVNDRADVARAAPARAVVTGRGGLSARDVRRAAPALLVGRSVHSGTEARAAEAEGADFLVAGPIYPTASHPATPAAGLDLVRHAAAGGGAVIAIGGLTPERTPDVVAAGGWGVAAIRALWDAPDPAAAVRAFLAALPASDAISLLVNGEPRRARPGTTVAELLRDLALDPRAVVVEHNRRVVRRDALEATALADGDAVELVHFVGGG